MYPVKFKPARHERATVSDYQYEQARRDRRGHTDLDVIQHGARGVEGDAPLAGGPAADEADAERPPLLPRLHPALLVVGHHRAEAERSEASRRGREP